jgi:hypothetical protein
MFPDGYAANLKRGASLDKLKIFGMKSHDWHICLERVMPVMLRGFIPKDEWLVLAELSYFFYVLCAKELSPAVIYDMEKLAPELLCKLEKIFPPGFFNPMQHLILHLPTEARLGGACKIIGAMQLRGCRRRFEKNVKINIELKHRWPRHSLLRRWQTS